METWDHHHLHHQSRLSNWDDVGKHFSMQLFADVWFFLHQYADSHLFFSRPKTLRKLLVIERHFHSRHHLRNNSKSRMCNSWSHIIIISLLLGVVGLMTWLAGLARVLPNDDWISLVWLVLLLILGSSIDDGNKEITEGKQLHPLDAGGGIQFVEEN